LCGALNLSLKDEPTLRMLIRGYREIYFKTRRINKTEYNKNYIIGRFRMHSSQNVTRIITSVLIRMKWLPALMYRIRETPSVFL